MRYKTSPVLKRHRNCMIWFNFLFLEPPQEQVLGGRPLTEVPRSRPGPALQRHFVPQGGAAGRGRGLPGAGAGPPLPVRASRPQRGSHCLVRPQPPPAIGPAAPRGGRRGGRPVARVTAGRVAAAAAPGGGAQPSRAERSGAEPGGPRPALPRAGTAQPQPQVPERNFVPAAAGLRGTGGERGVPGGAGAPRAVCEEPPGRR